MRDTAAERVKIIEHLQAALALSTEESDGILAYLN